MPNITPVGQLHVTRMLRSKSVGSVLIRLFLSGKTYSVVKGGTKLLETESNAEAQEAFAKAVATTPKGPALKRKPKAPIIYRGGLPSLGKRHS